MLINFAFKPIVLYSKLYKNKLKSNQLISL